MLIVTATSLLLPAYTEKKPVFCGMDDHEHTLACYADPNADLENEASWSAGLPSLSEELPLSERLVKTARSQLGYHESERNYIVLDDGSKAGRTRYGTFAGEPYGLWGGAFVKFCMHYAGLTNAGYPQSKNSAELRQMLISEGLYEDHCASPYHALPGDLVFFTGENAKLSVGIVYEANAATGDLYAVAGDQGGEVREIAIQFTEARLLGFGRLPDSFRPAKPEVPAGTANIIEETPSETPLGDENTEASENGAEDLESGSGEAGSGSTQSGTDGEKPEAVTDNSETGEGHPEAMETALTDPDPAEEQGNIGSVDQTRGEKELEDSGTVTRPETDAENSDAKEDREASEKNDKKPGIVGEDMDANLDGETLETSKTDAMPESGGDAD
ncbi:MAG: hypothetical protein ACSW75_02240, partial [Lachnospiraceae bacterium]